LTATTEYLFVQTYPGWRGAVADALRAVVGVAEATETIGPYDVLARVEAADVPFADGIAERARRIDGVLRVLSAQVTTAA